MNICGICRDSIPLFEMLSVTLIYCSYYVLFLLGHQYVLSVYPCKSIEQLFKTCCFVPVLLPLYVNAMMPLLEALSCNIVNMLIIYVLWKERKINIETLLPKNLIVFLFIFFFLHSAVNIKIVET